MKMLHIHTKEYHSALRKISAICNMDMNLKGIMLSKLVIERQILYDYHLHVDSKKNRICGY